MFGVLALSGTASAEPRAASVEGCESPAMARALVSLVRSGGLRSSGATEQTLRLSGWEDRTNAKDRSRPHWRRSRWTHSDFSCLSNTGISLTHWPAELVRLDQVETRPSHSLDNGKLLSTESCLTGSAVEQALFGEPQQTDMECRATTSHGLESGKIKCWKGSTQRNTTWFLKLKLDANGRCVWNITAYWNEPAVKLTAEQQLFREAYHRALAAPVFSAIPATP